MKIKVLEVLPSDPASNNALPVAEPSLLALQLQAFAGPRLFTRLERRLIDGCFSKVALECSSLSVCEVLVRVTQERYAPSISETEDGIDGIFECLVVGLILSYKGGSLDTKEGAAARASAALRALLAHLRAHEFDVEIG